jgi:hypothetical protein
LLRRGHAAVERLPALLREEGSPEAELLVVHAELAGLEVVLDRARTVVLEEQARGAALVQDRRRFPVLPALRLELLVQRDGLLEAQLSAQPLGPELERVVEVWPQLEGRARAAWPIPASSRSARPTRM